MSDHSYYLQPAFVLQQQKFKETSLIIDVFTRDFGRISLMAKGVRKAKSKHLSLLQLFVPLRISFYGKNELKTVTDVELIPPAYPLKGLTSYCGFYVNELLSHFLHKHDPHPELFQFYSQCLCMLSTDAKIEATLRNFEINLLNEVGYGLNFYTDTPIDPEKTYWLNEENSFSESENGQISGATIKALAIGELESEKSLSEAKMLLRTLINFHLHGKPLKSREIINNFIRKTL
jgi:DNA repair protein RecO (recombination protein O)